MFSPRRTSDAATLQARGAMSVGLGRKGFRPVALPALAAAVHVGESAAQAARLKLAARRAPRIVHEDEPSDRD